MISRHGARYPSKSPMLKMLELVKFFNNYNVTHHALINFSIPYSIESESLLSDSGLDQLGRYGKRMLNKYKDIYKSNNVRASFSSKVFQV
jgi:hypothetical protein